MKFNYRIEKSSRENTIHIEIKFLGRRNIKNIATESSREKYRNCEQYRVFFSYSCFKVNIVLADMVGVIESNII